MHSNRPSLTGLSNWTRNLMFVGLALFAPGLAGATTVTASASSFTGDPLSVSLTIDDAATPGDLVITLSVDRGYVADLRGFFAHIADESLLAGLSVSGRAVTDGQFAANAVIDLGHGANLYGGGTPCPCDLGVEIGFEGIGHGDDHQQVTFTLSHATANLTVDLFAGQSFGVRATSVGTSTGRECAGRDGSSKLIGVVPEPSTAVLALLGLSGLALTRPSKRA
jgi:hypothetical protein